MRIRRPHLISNWKKAYNFFSVQASALASLALVGWIALPSEQQRALLSVVGLDTPAYAALVAFVVVVLGRIVAQPPKEGE